MQTYRGSCHCGSVVFQIETEIDQVSVCDCSICCKKGILHYPVQDKHFTLLEAVSYTHLTLPTIYSV